MFIAVVGCGHGEIDKIYEVVFGIEEKRKIKVSLVLCCGDFQSVRNMTDLRCMACPIKYQQMHDFHRYYSGEKTAPVLTVFVGGNHEASNYLQELSYGGWVAPNIYFLSTGIVRFSSLRIAGVSGIYKGRDYLKGKYEHPPYSQDTMRSVYHYRNIDLFRMKQVKGPVDIVISHDWPKNIHTYGDTLELLRKKPFFRDEIERDELGSRPLSDLLFHLQPPYWFSAHMHVKFGAVIPHEASSVTTDSNDADAEGSISKPKTTKFLALDKILPRRQFLQLIEIPDVEMEEGGSKLYYDPEWLAILKSTNHLLSVKQSTCFMPGPKGAQSRFDFGPTDTEIEEICTLFDRKLEISATFVQTASPYESGERPSAAYPIENPQTINLCEKLGISDPLRLLHAYSNGIGFESHESDNLNNYGSFIGDEGKDASSPIPGTHESTQSTSFTKASFNPDEISLEDDEELEFGNQTYQSFTSPSTSTPEKFNFLNVSQTLQPVRRKLELPPPKTLEDSSKQSKEELELLQSILGSTVDPIIEENPFFVIDKIGEPELKKRRNESMYKSTFDASDDED